MRKELTDKRTREQQEANLTADERKSKHSKESYDRERMMLKDLCIIERNVYLKIKIAENIDYLLAEGIRTINGVTLKEIWSIDTDVEVVYNAIKEVVDDIVAKKQEEAGLFASKLFIETDLKEKAMRIFEKPLVEEELIKRNDTEIADLKENLRNKHEIDIKLKHLLIDSKKSMDVFIVAEMIVREQELKDNIVRHIADKTLEAKESILEKAKKSLRAEENKKLMDERRKKIAERQKKDAADRPDVSEGSCDEDDTGAITRKGFGTRKATKYGDRDEGDRGRRGDDRNNRRDGRDDKSDYSGSDSEEPRRDTGGRAPPKFGRQDGGAGLTRDRFAKVKDETKNEEGDDKTSAPSKFTDKSSGGPPRFSSSKPTFTGTKKGADADDWKKGKPKEDAKTIQAAEEAKKTVVTTKKPKPKKKDDDNKGIGRFETAW
jgi:hypothetical protein